MNDIQQGRRIKWLAQLVADVLTRLPYTRFTSRVVDFCIIIIEK